MGVFSGCLRRIQPLRKIRDALILYALCAAPVQAASLSEGTYRFRFTATLAAELFGYEDEDCSGGVSSFSDYCLTGASPFGQLSYSTAAGLAALDTADIRSPLRQFRRQSANGALTIVLRNRAETGRWLSDDRDDFSIECRIGQISCGLSAPFFQVGLKFMSGATGNLEAQFWISDSGSWSGELSPTRYRVGFNEAVAGLGQQYDGIMDLSGFRLVASPLTVPGPPASLLLVTALATPAVLRRRKTRLSR